MCCVWANTEPPHKDTTTEDYLCMFAQHTAPFIQTPLFVLQSRFDSWQQVLDCTMPSATQFGLLQVFFILTRLMCEGWQELGHCQ